MCVCVCVCVCVCSVRSKDVKVVGQCPRTLSLGRTFSIWVGHFQFGSDIFILGRTLFHTDLHVTYV